MKLGISKTPQLTTWTGKSRHARAHVVLFPDVRPGFWFPKPCQEGRSRARARARDLNLDFCLTRIIRAIANRLGEAETRQ